MIPAVADVDSISISAGHGKASRSSGDVRLARDSSRQWVTPATLEVMAHLWNLTSVGREILGLISKREWEAVPGGFFSSAQYRVIPSLGPPGPLYGAGDRIGKGLKVPVTPFLGDGKQHQTTSLKRAGTRES